LVETGNRGDPDYFRLQAFSAKCNTNPNTQVYCNQR
jgi:hypothetical protein